MKLLLDDRLAPITSEIGFIACELQVVASWFRDWRTRVHANAGVAVESQEVTGSLEHKLKSLLPLTSVLRRRFLFVSCKIGPHILTTAGTRAMPRHSPMSRKSWGRVRCASLRFPIRLGAVRSVDF